MSKRRWVVLGMMLGQVATGTGCGDGAAGTGPEDPVPSGPTAAEQALIGAWTSTDVDHNQEELEFVLTLEEDGRLSMVEKRATGVQLSFPGTWALEGGLLVLRGAYFEPDGEARVSYSLSDGNTLVLEDDSGAQGTWTRL